MKHFLTSTAIARIIAPIAFMSVYTTETVIIETENGPVRINKTDMKSDDKLHALNGTVISTPEPAVPVATPIVPPNGPPAIPQPAHNTNPAGGGMSTLNLQVKTEPVVITDPEIIARITAMNFAVITTGKGKAARYFIVNTLDEGNPVEGVPGIAKDGYATNKEAWDALYLVQLSIPRTAPGG